MFLRLISLLFYGIYRTWSFFLPRATLFFFMEIRECTKASVILKLLTRFSASFYLTRRQITLLGLNYFIKEIIVFGSNGLCVPSLSRSGAEFCCSEDAWLCQIPTLPYLLNLAKTVRLPSLLFSWNSVVRKSLAAWL